MELWKALLIANNLVKKLKPVCYRVEIAGSIRRKKTEVKDIELVVIPKQYGDTSGDLFEPKCIMRPVPAFVTMVTKELGTVIKGRGDGRYMQIELPEEIKLDLFIPAEGDYFRQFAIRTGSADYSHKIIANGWRKIGWVGSNVGLRKEVDCDKKIVSEDGKISWICNDPLAELPPVWNSEKEFFEWIKVPYLEPEKRLII